MMQVIEQTHEEKMKMYMKLPKKEIIAMLIQCNKILDSRYGVNENFVQPAVIKSVCPYGCELIGEILYAKNGHRCAGCQRQTVL